MTDRTSEPREFTQVELDITSLPVQGNARIFCPNCEHEHVYGECPLEGTCLYCKTRPAILHFGDMLSFTHGGMLNCCELCCARMQLEHAELMTAELPQRRAKYESLLEKEES